MCGCVDVWIVLIPVKGRAVGAKRDDPCAQTVHCHGQITCRLLLLQLIFFLLFLLFFFFLPLEPPSVLRVDFLRPPAPSLAVPEIVLLERLCDPRDSTNPWPQLPSEQSNNRKRGTAKQSRCGKASPYFFSSPLSSSALPCTVSGRSWAC